MTKRWDMTSSVALFDHRLRYHQAAQPAGVRRIAAIEQRRAPSRRAGPRSREAGGPSVAAAGGGRGR
ncbi:MAG TPA: hypothetical protein VHQ90_19800 [Thermoanaerobaculia bacterium]|nr:hypothetical protein [Thermoanaerobaculia bacterium]